MGRDHPQGPVPIHKHGLPDKSKLDALPAALPVNPDAPEISGDEGPLELRPLKSHK
jgi:hypothetical protein